MRGSAFADIELVCADDNHDNLVLKCLDRFGRSLFFQEARALAKVRGIEGLQQVEAVMVEGRRYTIVSRYAGDTLSKCVKEEFLSCDQLEDVLHQLGAALERMHEAGVTHRDLHLSNVCVLFEEQVRAEIIDFGYARSEAESKFEENKRYDRDCLFFLGA
ncbi:mitogen-activated protein kinase 12-like [Penaeus indicus]|uniref:mitogen-activated protein kinase 12-like n=1 Tax=Penaeus indicus TaxID=29960 RepID=UPI00300D9C6E